MIFLFWLPSFLAAWPGVFVIDNVFQMKWYLEGTVSAHHPVLHTYLLGSILKLGMTAFGSWEAGLCIFSVLQMIFLSGVFAYMITKLKKDTGKKVYVAALLFFTLVPYNSVSAFTATKDTVFAGVFLLLVLRTYLIARNPDSFFSSWKSMVSYGVLVFLMCAFRNTGIYLFIFSAPAFLVVYRAHWKKTLLIVGGCVLTWGIFTGPVYGALGVEKGSSAEMLSVPMQQLARAMVYAPEEFTQEQWELALEYMPDYDRYASRVADPVKDSFNGGMFDESPVRFVRLWAGMGVKCPGIYVEAFFSMNIGFWNPLMEYPDPGTYLAYIPYHSADLETVGTAWDGQVFVQQKSLRPFLSDFYEKMTENGSYNRILGLRFVYSIATGFWLMAAGLVYCIVKRKWSMVLPFFLLVGLWGTLMLSPVVAFRYGYPLLISLPVVWACVCRKENRN